MPTARITSKGQITIPKEVRDRLGVKAGDSLEFEFKDERVEIRPRRRLSILDFVGIFKVDSPPTMSWEEQREIAWREATRRLWDPAYRTDDDG